MVTICIAYFVPMSRHIGIQNGRHLKSTFLIIFESNVAIDLILVPKCMFFGVRNPMVTICIVYFLPMRRHIGFQNGRNLKSTFLIICRFNAAIDSILASKCMFWGARNPMVTICIAYFAPMSRHIGIQNGRHLKSTFSIISGSNAAIDSILVSKCMFCGARNPMATLCIVYFLSMSRHIGF